MEITDLQNGPGRSKERHDWHLTERVEHEFGRGDPFAAAIRTTRMPMVITDPKLPDNPIVFANDAFQNMTGYSREEILGRNCRFLQGPNTDQEKVRELGVAIQAQDPITLDLLNYRKDGTTFWNALHVSPVHDSEGELTFYFASQVDVTDRVVAEETANRLSTTLEAEVRKRTIDLEHALAEKTTLMHEVDHRVKNNLAMISSLVRMRLRKTPDGEARDDLAAIQRQVDTLASVHKRLYLSDEDSRFDLAPFLQGLATDLLSAVGRQEVSLDLDLDDLDIQSSKATALGLMLAEVLTNSLKHAFDGHEQPRLTMTMKSGDPLTLTIADNGSGYDLNVPQGSSLGRTLIERLAAQIDAETLWRSDERGTQVIITVRDPR